MRSLASDKNTPFPPIAFVSGGANAAIQNARAKKYVAACQSDGWLPKEIDVTFIRGADSDQDYLNQGKDALSDAEIRSAKQSGAGVEREKIAHFLQDHPDAMVFGLKRPDEMVGDEKILPLLAETTLVNYAGGYNTRVSDKAALKKFYEAPKQTSFAQNFIMMQNGGDKTPSNISPSDAPLFCDNLKRICAGGH